MFIKLAGWVKQALKIFIEFYQDDLSDNSFDLNISTTFTNFLKILNINGIHWNLKPRQKRYSTLYVNFFKTIYLIIRSWRCFKLDAKRSQWKIIGQFRHLFINTKYPRSRLIFLIQVKVILDSALKFDHDISPGNWLVATIQTAWKNTGRPTATDLNYL